MTSPYRSRHQVTRSISELYSPVQRRSASKQESTPSLYISTMAGSSTSISSTTGTGSVGGPTLETTPGLTGSGSLPQPQHHHSQRGKRLDAVHSGFVPGQSSTPASAASAEGFAGAEPIPVAMTAGTGTGTGASSFVANPSGDSSRRASLLGISLSGGDAVSGRQTLGSGDETRHNHYMPISMAQSQTQLHAALWEEQVKLCQAQSVSTLEEMVSDLKDFSTYSIQYTEETYRSIVDLYLSLRQAVENMRALVGKSSEVTKTFVSEAESLDSDVRSQLEAFRNLDQQTKRIKEMHSRIRSGRHKMEALSMRVDTVKNAVERWETADAEWQERTRKRLRSVWIVLLILLAVGLVVVVVQGVGVGDLAPDKIAGSATGKDATANIAVPDIVEIEQAGKVSKSSTIDQDVYPLGTPSLDIDAGVSQHDSATETGWDESLRVFDEL
ncbi:hypothetical protein Cpir12675_001309 [Ceratocystis pirilliformis]|uniref:Uncharacterized protein n=1 Tax=Ceratocystis pirilliformis TaxID=259994 RepID=A0ABR3ZFZ7_9PEZI